jgi:hypothetical protein
VQYIIGVLINIFDTSAEHKKKNGLRACSLIYNILRTDLVINEQYITIHKKIIEINIMCYYL